MEFDINNLTNEQKEKLVEQLWDLFQQKMTNDPQRTYFAELGTGNQKAVDITTNGGEMSIDNPFKTPVEGYFIALGDRHSSLKLKQNNRKNLVFDTSSLNIGTKVKVMLISKGKSDVIGG